MVLFLDEMVGVLEVFNDVFSVVMKESQVLELVGVWLGAVEKLELVRRVLLFLVVQPATPFFEVLNMSTPLI